MYIWGRCILLSLMATTLYAVDKSTKLVDIEHKIEYTQRNIHQAEMLIRRQQSELEEIQRFSLAHQGNPQLMALTIVYIQCGIK